MYCLRTIQCNKTYFSNYSLTNLCRAGALPTTDPLVQLKVMSFILRLCHACSIYLPTLQLALRPCTRGKRFEQLGLIKSVLVIGNIHSKLDDLRFDKIWQENSQTCKV